MSKEKFLIVIYQFGKVASTAIVKSLNGCEGVEAHQCHFLGNDALQRIVPNATNPNLGEYFRKHTVGQLMNNLELTYQVNLAMRKEDSRQLLVVSLSREPLDWFRSCIQQDILGYKDDLLAYSQEQGGISPPPSIENGLVNVLGDLSKALAMHDGAQNAIDAFGIGSGQILPALRDQFPDEFARRIFLLALRPLVWFDEHFARCFGVKLDEIPQNAGFWSKSGDAAQFVLMRYEDIEDTFSEAMQSVGVPFQGKNLCHANMSKDKAFADEIRNAFASDTAEELQRQLVKSNYAKHFGYDSVPSKQRALLAG